MSENENIFRRWIKEVRNERKVETIEELFHEDGIAVCAIHPPENSIRGINGFKLFFHHVFDLFTNIDVTVTESSDDGEKIVALCDFTASRIQKSQDGNKIHEPFTISGMFQIKFSDGKLLESWTNFDLFKAGI